MNPEREPGPAAGASPSETRLLFALWLLALFATGGILAVWIALSRPGNMHYVWITALALATVPGKLVIFSGLAPDSPLGPWGVALIGVAVDVILSMSLSLGLGPFRRLPGFGTWLDRVNRQTAEVLSQYPRLKRMAFWGAALFVALPVPGSGWIGGTFVSQLVGLSRPMGVAAIAVGATASGAVFALMAQAMGAQAKTVLTSPWIAGSGLVVTALAGWLVWHLFRGLLQRR